MDPGSVHSNSEDHKYYFFRNCKNELFVLLIKQKEISLETKLFMRIMAKVNELDNLKCAHAAKFSYKQQLILLRKLSSDSTKDVWTPFCNQCVWLEKWFYNIWNLLDDNGLVSTSLVEHPLSFDEICFI
jgi:hypothetical protein